MARGSGARSAGLGLAAGIVGPALREERAEPDVQVREGGVGLDPDARVVFKVANTTAADASSVRSMIIRT